MIQNKNYLSIYAKSFNWAGFFLPKQTYKKCSSLYDFCRVVDNIADDKNSVELKESEFNEFKNDFIQKNYNNPIIKNMWEIIDEFNISLKVVNDLFDGIKSDIKGSRCSLRNNIAGPAEKFNIGHLCCTGIKIICTTIQPRRINRCQHRK